MSAGVPSTGNEEPVRVVIADASPFVATGLRAALEAGGLVVVDVCADADATHLAAVQLRPDAVLLSVDLPGGVLPAIQRIRTALPGTAFLVLDDDADDDSMMRMVAAGVRGILLGHADPARLPQAVRGVLDGEVAFPRRLVRAMADELARRDARRRAPGVDGAMLTPREYEVLDAFAAERGVQEVAAELGISAATVRRHAANAARKVGVAKPRGRGSGPAAR